MDSIRDMVLTKWHGILNLRRYPPSFHRARLAEELLEQREATTYISRLSETSDVLFTTSRARHQGSPVGRLPPLAAPHAAAYAYMLAKFTSRWAFYRAAGRLCGDDDVREVINPLKDEKLVAVAMRHGLDPVRFRKVAGLLRRVWPLLP